MDACIVVCVLDLMVNTTLQYLQERASSKEPFYLFQSFTTPHAGGIGNVSLFSSDISSTHIYNRMKKLEYLDHMF